MVWFCEDRVRECISHLLIEMALSPCPVSSSDPLSHPGCFVSPDRSFPTPLHLCSSQLHSSVHDTQASHLGLLYSFLFYLTPDYVFSLQPNTFLALNTLSPETVQICRLPIENTSMQLFKTTTTLFLFSS